MGRANQILYLFLRRTAFERQSTSRCVHPFIEQKALVSMFQSSSCIHTSSAQQKDDSTESFLDSLWRPSQTQKILHGLNTLSQKELETKLKISRTLSEKILSTRPFDTIGQIMDMPRVNVISLEKLCRNVLKLKAPKEGDQEKGKPKHTLLSHAVSPEVAQSTKHITVLDLGAEWTTYLTMSDDFQLGKYRFQKCDISPNANHVEIVNKMREVVDWAQLGDVILIISPHYRPSKQKPNKHILSNRPDTLHYTFLGMMSSCSDVSKIFTIKERHVASEFELYIGNSITSPENVIRKLLEDKNWNGHNLTDTRSFEMERNDRAGTQVQRTLDMLFLTNLYFIDKFLLPVRAREQLMRTQLPGDIIAPESSSSS